MTVLASLATEAEWQDAVLDYAHLRQWRVSHFRAARTDKGWRTPVAADGKGWPDLVLVRDRIVYAELKSAKGKLTREQREWMIAIRGAGGEFHCWTPLDYDQMLKVLR